jgi:hypothetical protein
VSARAARVVSAVRVGYNATVEKICRALEVSFHDLLEMIDDPPKPKRKRAPSKKKAR